MVPPGRVVRVPTVAPVPRDGPVAPLPGVGVLGRVAQIRAGEASLTCSDHSISGCRHCSRSACQRSQSGPGWNCGHSGSRSCRFGQSSHCSSGFFYCTRGPDANRH